MNKSNNRDQQTITAYRNSAGGMTLLEIMIAVSILVSCTLFMVMTLRRGGMKEESFSSEHFTAMFLAQKVLEDINDRIIINPHYFSQLVAYASTGKSFSVVDGQSPYFRLLENTKNFDELVEGDDEPINKNSGHLYDQLKNFACKVETGFLPNPDSPGQAFRNLVDVTVTISWTNPQGQITDYKLKQMVYGTNDEMYKVGISDQSVSDFDEKLAAKTLFKWLDPDHKADNWLMTDFTAFNGGGDPETLKSLGCVLAGLLMCDATTKEFDQSIARAKSARDFFLKKRSLATRSRLIKYQEHLAELREQRANTMFYIFSRLAPDIQKLEKCDFNVNTIGEKMSNSKKKLVGIAPLMLNHLLKVSLSYASAEATFKELLANPYRDGIHPNQQIGLIQHWMDLRKLGLLLSSHWDLNEQQRVVEHAKVLDDLIGAYKGRLPGFVTYLNHEKNISRNLPILKEELKALDKQLIQVTNLHGSLMKINAKLKPKSAKK